MFTVIKIFYKEGNHIIGIYKITNKNTGKSYIGQSNNIERRFSEHKYKEVIELRSRYVNETAKEIWESVKDRCKYQTMQQILWGRHYKHLPIYSKKTKTWIEPVSTISEA